MLRDDYEHLAMDCRVGCAACCVELSISSPIPGMPEGKKGGVRCVQLDAENRCLLFGAPERPQVCIRFRPQIDACGSSNADAYFLLNRLEQLTRPH